MAAKKRSIEGACAGGTRSAGAIDGRVTLGPGALLPDVPVVRPDGAAVSLRDDLAGEATLLVFLRHLG